MPVLRYFLFVGSALLALFVVADWYWAGQRQIATADESSQVTSIDAIQRIQSAQKWPQKIVFDTSIPTVVPPPALVTGVPPAPPPPAAVLDALAEARPEAKPQTPVRKVAAVRHRAAKPVSPRMAAYPTASAWSPWW